MSKQEDKIKTYLHLLGDHDDMTYTSYDFKNKFKAHKLNQTYRGFDEFSDITDWQDNRETYYAASLPKLTKSKELTSKFINGMEINSYKSSLLKDKESRKSDDSIFISPVVIKFNASNANSSPRKSQLLYHRILHNDDGRKI